MQTIELDTVTNFSYIRWLKEDLKFQILKKNYEQILSPLYGYYKCPFCIDSSITVDLYTSERKICQKF
ncbi:hypothetical protein PITCH_A1180006 [uncultured Desulfobacterium sp.]|uniref:Uncharacterized protein n=1 Tax=uncultured Desulfobacterium sp. TaxID=201089 RepID=A0A445MRN3_9BACT|nr:hypothetical protein PITCH_A1180006 [uncultured Desulfobacterium sp.]